MGIWARRFHVRWNSPLFFFKLLSCTSKAEFQIFAKKKYSSFNLQWMNIDFEKNGISSDCHPQILFSTSTLLGNTWDLLRHPIPREKSPCNLYQWRLFENILVMRRRIFKEYCIVNNIVNIGEYWWWGILSPAISGYLWGLYSTI